MATVAASNHREKVTFIGDTLFDILQQRRSTWKAQRQPQSDKWLQPDAASALPFASFLNDKVETCDLTEESPVPRIGKTGVGSGCTISRMAFMRAQTWILKHPGASKPANDRRPF